MVMSVSGNVTFSLAMRVYFSVFFLNITSIEIKFKDNAITLHKLTYPFVQAYAVHSNVLYYFPSYHLN